MTRRQPGEPQPGAAGRGGPATGIPLRNLPGPGRVPGRPLPRSGYVRGHVVCWSAGTPVPARGSRARASTRTPWCRAAAGDSPAASAGEAEAKGQAMMGAAGGRPGRPSPSRRAEALAGCASTGGSSWPGPGTVNAGAGTPIFSCTHSWPRPVLRFVTVGCAGWCVRGRAIHGGQAQRGKHRAPGDRTGARLAGSAGCRAGLWPWRRSLWLAVAPRPARRRGQARSRRAPQARASRDHARHRHLPPRLWAASRDERPITRPAGPPDHAARGQPGVRRCSP